MQSNLDRRLAKLEERSSPKVSLDHWIAWRDKLYKSGRLIETDGIVYATQKGDTEAQKEAALENQAHAEIAAWEASLPVWDPLAPPPEE